MSVVPVVALRQDAILGRVVPHREQQRVRHVRLEAKRLRTVHHLEQLHHAFPTVHPAPADFSFGREPLAVTLRDVACLAERTHDPLRIRVGIVRPLARTCRRVDAHDAVRTDAQIAKSPTDRARLTHLRQEVPAILVAAHGRSAASRRPHRRDKRSDDESPRRDVVGQALQIGARRIDAQVGIEEEQIDAVEPGAVDRRRRGEVEHRVEINGRLRSRAAFPDQPRPHRVVELRIGVLFLHESSR